MFDAGTRFADWFSSTFVLPWWAFTLLLLVAAGAFRVFRVLTAEAREAKRRRALLMDLKEFIGGAVRANVQRARELRRQKMVQHATLFVRSWPMQRLRDVSGIGRATIETLRANGYATLGDVVDNDIRGVHTIGQVKFDAARRFISAQMEAAFAALMAGSSDVPLDPQTEEVYNAAIDELGVQNERLERDHEGLQPAADEVAAYEAQAAQRTNAVRLREWVRSPLTTLRTDPYRPLRFGLLATLFVSIAAGLPHVAMGWDSSLSSATATVSFASTYFAAHFFVAVYAFASERAVRIGTRPLDPANYQEQRLQFLGLTMALERGIAPPEVRITDSMVTETRGHRTGPSLIALPDEQVRHLAREASQATVEFMLAREVGELSGDHQRVSTTIATLLAPFAWLAHGVVRLTAASIGGLYRSGSAGAVLVAACCLSFPLLFVVPVAVSVICIYLAVAAIRVVLSTESVFDADRTGRELTSDDAMKEMFATLAKKRRVDQAAAHLKSVPTAAVELLVVEESPPRHVRAARWINAKLDALANVRPSLRRRLRVIDHPSVPAIDLGLGVARAGLVLAVAFIGLFFSGVELRAALSAIPRLPSRAPFHPQTASPTPPRPPAEAVPEQPTRIDARVHVLGGASSCNLRRSPSFDGGIIGAVHEGERCEVLPYDDEHFAEVDCGGRRGFLGRRCLDPTP